MFGESKQMPSISSEHHGPTPEKPTNGGEPVFFLFFSSWAQHHWIGYYLFMFCSKKKKKNFQSMRFCLVAVYLSLEQEGDKPGEVNLRPLYPLCKLCKMLPCRILWNASSTIIASGFFFFSFFRENKDKVLNYLIYWPI